MEKWVSQLSLLAFISDKDLPITFTGNVLAVHHSKGGKSKGKGSDNFHIEVCKDCPV